MLVLGGGLLCFLFVVGVLSVVLIVVLVARRGNRTRD
jgi:hypothetical protein